MGVLSSSEQPIQLAPIRQPLCTPLQDGQHNWTAHRPRLRQNLRTHHPHPCPSWVIDIAVLDVRSQHPYGFWDVQHLARHSCRPSLINASWLFALLFCARECRPWLQPLSVLTRSAGRCELAISSKEVFAVSEHNMALAIPWDLGDCPPPFPLLGQPSDLSFPWIPGFLIEGGFNTSSEKSIVMVHLNICFTATQQ